ncbi:hypothetical protein PV783_17395 [Chitinophaga sp. CC14]|uniref:hypothetical protein n=1 Tax=Chitinophaga sp. CC14 TaxID=3029199 RepID=UPI003B771E6A
MANNIEYRGGDDKVIFIPDHVIDSYKVVKHTHPGHLVYETGHQLYNISNHNDYQSGYKGLFDAIKDEPLPVHGFVAFSLYATYQGAIMKYEYDGEIMGDTGFYVASAFPPNRWNDQQWTVEQVYNPSAPFALKYPAGYYSDELRFDGPDVSINKDIYDLMQQEYNKGNVWMAFDTRKGDLTVDDFAFSINKWGAEHKSVNLGEEYSVKEVVELKSIPMAVKGIIYGVPSVEWYESVSPVLLTNKFISEMSEKVLEYHKNDLRKIGAGNSLDDALAINIKSGKPEFKLYDTKQFGEDLVVVTFPYKRSTREGSDLVFRNGMELLVRPKVGEIQKQTFVIGKDAGNVTIKNAYNAMQQRSFLLNKDTNEWAYLNFKETDKQGNHPLETVKGFDIRKVAGPLPINDLKDPEKADDLYASLERGNRQHVQAGEKSFFIEASPKHDTLRVYTASLQKSSIEELKKAAGINQSTDQVNKQGVANDASSQKQERQKGPSIS